MDGLLRRYLFSGDKITAAISHIPFEGFREAFYIAMFQKISRIMPAGNDRTGEGFFQLVKRNIDSRFLKVPAHFFIPENAGIHKSLDLLAEGRHFIINEQSENMDILSHIFGGKFDAGYDFKGIAGIIFYCFIKAVYRVMICEREGVQPFFSGQINQL